jgi:hypothetical protein
MCIAAWLALVTGIGVSAAAAMWVRGLIVVIWVVGAAVVMRQMMRGQAVKR